MPSLRKIALPIETSTSWGQDLIQGICRFSRERAPDWELHVAWLGRHETVTAADLPRCDGVIARMTREAVARDIAGLRVPAVNVSGAHWPLFDHCTWDEAGVAKAAADHLKRKGFRRFAYVGPLHPRKEDRLPVLLGQAVGDGLKAAFRFDAGLREEDQERALLAFLRGLPHPVGILVWGPEEGVRVLNLCRRQGWRVPQDMGVLAGDDDALLCGLRTPALSGVNNVPQVIGYRAAEMLAQRMADPGLPVREVFVAPAGVRARGSTDCFACGDPLVVRAQELIRRRIDEPLAVRDILDELRLSRRALEARFQAALKHAPAEEIRRQKMEAAREQLATTNLSPKKIASFLGWKDEAAFRRAFSRACGETPAAYRSRCQSGLD